MFVGKVWIACGWEQGGYEVTKNMIALSKFCVCVQVSVTAS
jgi:hypothetical protein